MSQTSIQVSYAPAFVPSGEATATMRGSKARSGVMTLPEPALTELARTGRLFYGGTTAVAGAIAPVADYPTTAGPLGLFTATRPASLICAVIDQITFFGASGTQAAGATLVATVALPTNANA